LISWINLFVLILSSFLLSIFYVKSVSPAALERKIGASAYKKCSNYRITSSVFMVVVTGNYILYYWYPLPLRLPDAFPWPWWVSATIAAGIVVPSLYLMLRGVKDAGEETMRPRPEHEMYGGIYKQIRHPQAVGEFPLWFVIAFLLDSPFLVLISFFYIPVWYYFCIAEEKDLLIRYGKAYEEYRQRVGFWIPKQHPKHGPS